MNENKDRQNNTDKNAELPAITALLIRPAINLQNMSPDQRVDLGYHLEKGDGTYEQDYEAARLAYASAAADGNPLAMNNLGWLYWMGYGVEKDIDKARQYFNQAVDQGVSTAMINLGNIAEYCGNYEEAYYWYRRAFILGDPVGQFNYANMYHWGWYVDQDYKYAYRNFRELAENGYVGAFFYIGHYLQEGLGVEKDEKEAFQWFEIGEQAKDAYSTTELGRCYALGLGVEKDEKKGFLYYLEGIARGDTLAYANVGYCYETGQGTEKDLEKARQYYHEGMIRGEENCRNEYERLTKELSQQHKKDKPSPDAYDEPFLKHMEEIGGTRSRLIAEFLMKAVRAMGIKTSYSNGTVFTSPILNIAPRTRPAGDYIRLEHRISKLVVEKRLGEKKIQQMFQEFGDKYGLWDDKRLKIQSSSYFLEMTGLYEENVLQDYVQLLRLFAIKHLPPKTKVLGDDDIWKIYQSLKAAKENEPGEREIKEPKEKEQKESETVKPADATAGNQGETQAGARGEISPDTYPTGGDRTVRSDENYDNDEKGENGKEEKKDSSADSRDSTDSTEKAVHLQRLDTHQKEEDYHNDTIEAAIHAYCGNPDTTTLLGVMLAVHQRLLEGAEVITPLKLDPDNSNDPDKQICTIGLKDSKGDIYMPILTSQAKEKDNPDLQIFGVMELKRALEATQTYDTDSVGIVLNPFSQESVKLPAEYVEALLASIADHS